MTPNSCQNRAESRYRGTKRGSARPILGSHRPGDNPSGRRRHHPRSHHGET
jgi:hypothetical protein